MVRDRTIHHKRKRRDGIRGDAIDYDEGWCVISHYITREKEVMELTMMKGGV